MSKKEIYLVIAVIIFAGIVGSVGGYLTKNKNIDREKVAQPELYQYSTTTEDADIIADVLNSRVAEEGLKDIYGLRSKDNWIKFKRLEMGYEVRFPKEFIFATPNDSDLIILYPDIMLSNFDEVYIKIMITDEDPDSCYGTIGPNFITDQSQFVNINNRTFYYSELESKDISDSRWVSIAQYATMNNLCTKAYLYQSSHPRLRDGFYEPTPREINSNKEIFREIIDTLNLSDQIVLDVQG